MNPNGHHGYRANNVASTSSNFSDILPQNLHQPLLNNNLPQQQQQQLMQHRNQSHWQDHAMQMNAQQMNGQMNGLPPHQIPSQPQSSFNQGLWGNQVAQLQSFPTNMPAMNPFGMPFLPQQIIQEAYAMCVPVEGSDEPILLTKLLSAARRKESYKDALNSLHGKDGHSASLWKDYYLDNKERLDVWIAMCLQKEQEGDRSDAAPGLQRPASSDVDRVKLLPTIKKPSPASFKHESSPCTSSSISVLPAKRPQKKPSHSTPPLGKDTSQGSRRSTINSITAPSPVYGRRLPAPNAEIKIPDPPSRSPSPPTNIIPHRGRGNKYTKDDQEFFIKFVGWRLKQDPALTRIDLCNLLAEKAPHHTAQSWASHWSGHHDIPDKILASARGEQYKMDEYSSDEEKVPPKRRPKYKDTTTSEESGDSESADGKDCKEEQEEDDSDEGDDQPIRHYAEKDMGKSGGPFTNADLYITAKYIAASADWENTNSKDRWEPHHQKYPQRSAKSWAEYYRRKERCLLKLVNKIKQQGNLASHVSASSINTQCARPTRAPVKAKRKFEAESDDESLAKRGREE